MIDRFWLIGQKCGGSRNMLEGAQKMSRQSSNTYTFLSHKLFRYFLFLFLLYCFTLSSLYCDFFFFVFSFSTRFALYFCVGLQTKKTWSMNTHTLYTSRILCVLLREMSTRPKSRFFSHSFVYSLYSATIYTYMYVYMYT